MLAPCRVCGNDVSKEAKTCPHCGQKHPTRSKNYWRNIGIGVFAIIVLGQIASFKDRVDAKEETASSAVVPRPVDPKKAYEDSVDLTINSWELGGFDNVMIADYTITNKGSRQVKDFAIACELKSKSGTPIDVVYRTIYEVAPANGKKRVREMNMGIVNTQVNTASCSIASFVFAD